MKRLNKGLLVTSGICGGLGLALLICGMLLGGIRGGNDLGDALSINSGDFQEMKDKRLYRSSTNYMICGVCGGIGEYFNIDPTLVRLAWVIFSFMGGSGILAYIIASIIIPK